MMNEYMVEGRPERIPTHPGEILREDVLPSLGISITEAAKQLGVTRQTLHRILKGSHGVTPAMAVRLGKFCNNSPSAWLRVQQAHDLRKAEIELEDEVRDIPGHITTFH